MGLEKVHYRGWDIVPFVISSAHGEWQASCEVERSGPHGLETFQGFSASFSDPDRERAVMHAIIDARQKIDELVADPLAARPKGSEL